MDEQDDVVECVYQYLCNYAANYIQPATEDEIALDLNLMPLQVAQVLAILQDEGRIHPSNMPCGVVFSSHDLQPPDR